MKYLITLGQLVLVFLMLTAMVLMMTNCKADQLNDDPGQPIPTTTIVTSNPGIVTTTTIKLEPSRPIPLSWEKGHPERKIWSEYLMKRINLDLFDQATDAKRICPKYETLKDSSKINMWAEFIVGLSFYESSWNPLSASPDVGTASNKDTWSVGLLQISVTDQLGDVKKIYTYEDLKKPIPNLDLGLKVMERQLKKRHKVILDNSDKMRYWAVALDSNRYSKVSEIIYMVRKAVPSCL